MLRIRLLRALVAAASALCAFWATIWMVLAFLTVFPGPGRPTAGERIGHALILAAIGFIGVVAGWAVGLAGRELEPPVRAPKGFDVLPPSPPPREKSRA